MAKGLKTLAALGGLGAAAYLAGKMGGKKDEDVDTTADASAGMAKTRLGKDESNYDELANMDRTKAARQGKAVKAIGKDMMKKAAPKAAAAAMPVAPRKADNSMMDELQGLSRLRENRGDMTETGSERIARKQEAGRDKMNNAYRDAFRNIFRRGESAGEDQGAGGIGENIVGAKRGGKIKAKKYAGGGSVGSASRRADGCAMRGKTKGRMV